MILSELQKLIADYISGVIQEEHPEVVTGPGSPFNDLFVAPLISIMSPFLTEFNRLDLNQDLSNAALMDTTDLDNIGENNYFVPRSLGQYASTTVTVFMDPSFVTADVTIPHITAAAGDLNYSSLNSTFIKLMDSSVPDSYATVLPGILSNYLNPATQKYEIPIYVVAENPGSSYNVDIGKINTLITKYPAINDAVTNYAKVDNGTDDEANTDYVDRIGKVYLTKNLGTDIGYREFILTEFAGVEDLIVIGNGDAEMVRDVLVDASGVPTSSHIGGKVDIYVKGSVLNTFTQSGFIQSAQFQLLQSGLDTSVGMIATNTTDASRIPVYHVTYQYPGVGGATPTGNVYVTIDNPAQLVAGDCITVQYNAFAASTDIQSTTYTDVFYFNSNKLRLAYAPSTTISTVINTTRSATVLPTAAYSLTKAADTVSTWKYNSASEPIDLVISDAAQYSSGDAITITGIYNSLIGTIQSNVNTLGNRIITTDVLAKQCPQKYVNVGLNVGLNTHYTLGTYETACILNIIHEVVEGSPIGGTIQSSDIINLLYADTSTNPFIDFVQTPIILFSSDVVSTDSDSMFMGNLSYVATSAGVQTDIVQSPLSTAAGVPTSNTTLIIPPIAPPTVTPVAGTTVLVAGTYMVCYSYQNAAGQTTTGPSASVTLATGNAIQVASLLPLPIGTTAVNYFLSTAVNSFNQAYVASGTGDVLTISALPLAGAAQSPLGNSTIVADPTTSPSASAVDGTTTLPAGTYLVAYSFTNTIGETLTSPTVSILLNDTQILRIAAITPPAGTTGVKYYIANPNYAHINSMVTMSRTQVGNVGRVVILEV